MADEKISALPAATALEDADKLALAQTLATSPQTNGATLAEVKAYVHTNTYSPSVVDATIDPAGSGSNNYSKIADAISDGHRCLYISGEPTDSADIALTQDMIWYFAPDVSWSVLVNVNLNGHGLRIENATISSGGMAANAAFFTGGNAYKPLVLSNVNWTNGTGSSGSHLCSGAPVLANFCTFYAANVTEGGLDIQVDGSVISNCELVANGSNVVNMLKMSTGTLSNVTLSIPFPLTGSVAELQGTASIDNLHIDGANAATLTLATSACSIDTRGAALPSIVVAGSNLNLSNMNAATLSFNSGVQNVGVSNSRINTLTMASDASNADIRLSNSAIATTPTLYGQNIKLSNIEFSQSFTTNANSSVLVSSCNTATAPTINGGFIGSANVGGIPNNFSYALSLNITVAPITLATWGYIVELDASSGNMVVNLPSAVDALGGMINLVRIDNSSNTITVNPNGTEKINGSQTPYTLTQQGESVTFCSNNTNVTIL